jgi:integrase
MPRSTKEGAPAAAPHRRKLTELYVKKAKGERRAGAFNVWDTYARGLVLRIQPTGHRAFKVVYRIHARPVWYHIGDARKIALDHARNIAIRIAARVAEGGDPEAERRAEQGAGTFGDLQSRYVESYAKKHNKSWKQADALITRHVLPRWKTLAADRISRADVKALMNRIEAPIAANQTVAAVSAVFTWAVKEELVTTNPCRNVERNPTKDRERILSNSEIPIFWKAFDNAGLVASSVLKTILLTGQRPGEVAHMRYEHIKDGFWEMPGAPEAKTKWPGTKNAASHRVWLPKPVRSIIRELSEEEASPTTGFVFAKTRRGPVSGLDRAMREICEASAIEPTVTPHDLRRTHGSTVTALGFGRDAMNRIQNHREGGIASVYDRHQYAEENKRIIETVAARIVSLAEGGAADNVVDFASASK